MRYTHTIADMKWSYTRITTFEDCRYKFLLTYIYHSPRQPLFFSSYGTFMHSILDQYLSGTLSGQDLVPYYTANFRTAVTGQAPTADTFRKYFGQGLDYLSELEFPFPTVSTEEKVDFFIGQNRFVGIIDCIAKDGDDFVIVDHKSHPLKMYSGKPIETKSDRELSSYLRQLYLYSVPIKCKFHTYPSALAFNCFRTNTVVKVPFSESKLKETCAWATEKIEEIKQNDKWNPSPDYFRCKYLCDVHDHCEYYKMI